MFVLWLTLIPTILFILITLWGFLLGLKRGFRKSVILLIQALVALAIAVTFYLIMVNLKASDEWVVNIINNFLGENGLQNNMGVSTENKALTDILTEYIITHNSYGKGVTLALEENEAYLATLVNFAYHIIYFIIALILYDILLFLFYLIYVIFYPERRHRAKMEKKELEEGSTVRYRKRHLLGSLVGGLRGLVKALVVMSFVGATLFLLGGGLGDYKYEEEYKFADPTRERLFKVYEALGSYGDSGIFKILNSVKDNNQVPYYFFVANVVFSGKYENADLGLSKNFYFVREFGEYTRFARSAFDLMFKYDKDTMVAVVNGEIAANDERVTKIFGNPDFQKEFTDLIDLVESDTYIINFALAMLDSIAYHIDDTSFASSMDEKSLELIKVLMVPTYYSKYIPEDQTAKSKGENVSTIVLSDFLTREDIKSFLAGILSLIAMPRDLSNTQKAFEVNRAMVPALRDLDALNNPERKEHINGALERVFVCLENMNREGTTQDNLTVDELLFYSEKANVEIDWADEISSLLDTVHNFGLLAEGVYDPNDTIMSAVFRIFDKSHKNYENNVKAYDKITANFEKSKILDKILSIKPLFDSFMAGLTSVYSDIYVPTDITFGNVEKDGNIKYGEIHYFLKTLRILLSDPTISTLIPNMLNGSSSGLDMILDLADLAESLLNEDEEGNTIISYTMESKIMQVFLSSLLFAKQNLTEDIQIYIPERSYVHIDGERKNLIDSDELERTFSVIPSLLREISRYLDPQDENYENVDYLVELISKSGSTLMSSDIIEGTLATGVKNILGKTDIVTIPKSLDNIDNWIGEGDEDGELPKLVRGKNALGLSIMQLISGGFDDSFATCISDLNEEKDGKTRLDVVCESKVLYATLTSSIDRLINKDFVEDNAKAACKEAVGVDTFYKKAELEALVDVINDLSLDITDINLTGVVDSIGSLNNESSVLPGSTKLDVMYNSILTSNMLYKELGKILDSNDIIVNHQNAKTVRDTNVNIYVKDEVKELIRFANNLGGSVLSELSLETIELDANTINNIQSSTILTATVSKYLIDNNVVVVLADAYDSTNNRNYIKNEELAALLTSVNDGLGIASVSGIDANAIKLPQADKIDELLNSSIMCATVSNKIKNEDNPIYVNKTLAEVKQTYDGESKVVVSKTELKNFILGISDLSQDNNYNVVINNEKLHELKESNKLDTALESSILHLMISNFLAKNGAYPDSYTDCYNIPAVTEVNIPFITKTAIQEAIA